MVRWKKFFPLISLANFRKPSNEIKITNKNHKLIGPVKLENYLSLYTFFIIIWRGHKKLCIHINHKIFALSVHRFAVIVNGFV